MSKIKKLIEVALPLDAINEASAREKSIRHGHPSTLHLWWARRPLATARAVIFASLVDAPSSHPELFPTKEAQDKERTRLFEIIERLVQWENINNKELFDEAYAEIKKYCGDDVPVLLDPFAGGGAIPLEAQRLGLKAVATDLNPVAVTINKAMIEVPPKYANMPPVNPKDRSATIGATSDWHGAQGLAADVKYYGEILKKKTFEKIGHLYPKVKNPKTGEMATVIAWIWARTVKCPNPACGCEMPLIHTFWLSKKKNKETYIEPIKKNGDFIFNIKYGKDNPYNSLTSRNHVTCLSCQAEAPITYVQEEGRKGNMGEKLIAIVAEGINERIYISPDHNDNLIVKNINRDEIDSPTGEISIDARHFSTNSYGLNNFSDLFSNRQLKTLTTFSDLLPEIELQINEDINKLSKDISDIKENYSNYAKSISIYLSFVIDKIADYNSTACSWHNSGEKIGHTLARQAIPMVWDYAESNPFSNSSGCFDNMLEWVLKSLITLPCKKGSVAYQADAAKDNLLRNIMISTDPPYYDNIGYADLSDFFYIWMRRSLKHVYPEFFGTLMVPKNEELIADPYRFPIEKSSKKTYSKEKAKEFFEDGMKKVCKLLFEYTNDKIPVTIYYAFKQKDKDAGGVSSSGWETMLSAIIGAGFSITGTWPMRTEMSSRSVAQGTNALASSIVLVCRKRSLTHQICSRKDFIRELRSELIDAIEKLQSASIAPVDMMQSAIGPGISVYSRYDQVLEADGSEMSVRTALQLINQELDAFFGGQSEGLDAESRFAVELFAQAGFDELDFGTADVLARAKNTSVASVADTGAIISGRGKVRIAKREEMEQNKTDNKTTWMTLQYLAFAMEREGIRGCAKVLLNTLGDNESLKNLAYHMYQLSEEKHLSQEAGVYNNLVISWNEILSATEELRSQQPEQMNLLEV